MAIGTGGQKQAGITPTRRKIVDTITMTKVSSNRFAPRFEIQRMTEVIFRFPVCTTDQGACLRWMLVPFFDLENIVFGFYRR